MNITLIAGARPNFMKVAPIIHAIQAARAAGNDIEYRLVHTGLEHLCLQILQKESLTFD